MRYVTFPVTKKAKNKAKKALFLRSTLPESKKFGLDKKEAKGMGINSGVERARQLSRSDAISYNDAERVAAFYQRNKNKKRTQKVQGSIDLWGGDDYGKKAVSFVKAHKGKRSHLRRTL